ncbi:MAG TPA: tellurite resistance/C4-dicarboxylate transporter family protein [Jatrophihabitans sp.]|nr:tellurite resistance/C4-dicarboxylate transporter family protein [Jatrophihabitans sp.]
MQLRRLRDVNLPPDVFAVVMATGIVAVAAADHAYHRISVVLGTLAAAAFLVLGVGLVVRIAVGPSDIAAQARDPDVALRMFTAVAACEVLGVRWDSHPAAVWTTLVLSVCGWLVLAPLSVGDVRARSRVELRDHAHGAWLLPSVALAGLATCAAHAALFSSSWWLLAAAGAAWLLGLGVYLAVTWLVAWRAVASPFGPEQVPPDSWILMGAVAVSALAGAHVHAVLALLHGPGWVLSTVRILTLICWVVASLWVPLLLYAEVWRVDRQSGSLHYQGVWWSAVFPIGMYSAASASCAHELRMHSLFTISLVFFWVAATVWLTVAAGAVHREVATLRRRRAAAHQGTVRQR